MRIRKSIHAACLDPAIVSSRRKESAGPSGGIDRKDRDVAIGVGFEEELDPLSGPHRGAGSRMRPEIHLQPSARHFHEALVDPVDVSAVRAQIGFHTDSTGSFGPPDRQRERGENENDAHVQRRASLPPPDPFLTS